MVYREIHGDLVKLALNGEFDVIAHGCNCQCIMGAGLAPQMAKAFGCDTYDLEAKKYKGSINKLGQIDFNEININISKNQIQNWKHLVIINAYTQFMYGTNHIDGVSKPLDYEALTLCLRKINHVFKGKHIGLPLIGCHLAGGVWDKNDLTLKMLELLPNNFKDVKTIIEEELKDMNVTIVHYKP